MERTLRKPLTLTSLNHGRNFLAWQSNICIIKFKKQSAAEYQPAVVSVVAGPVMSMQSCVSHYSLWANEQLSIQHRSSTVLCIVSYITSVAADSCLFAVYKSASVSCHADVTHQWLPMSYHVHCLLTLVVSDVSQLLIMHMYADVSSVFRFTRLTRGQSGQFIYTAFQENVE